MASGVGVPLETAGRLGYAGGGDGGGDAAAAPASAPRLNLSGFKKRVVPVIAEFFDSEDFDEVARYEHARCVWCRTCSPDLAAVPDARRARAVLDLGTPFFHYELVKRAVTMSMDKNDRERELASRLISTLCVASPAVVWLWGSASRATRPSCCRYPKVLPMDQIGKGFERLLELADDLELDNPDAHKMLAQFLGRAVVDEVGVRRPSRAVLVRPSCAHTALYAECGACRCFPRHSCQTRWSRILAAMLCGTPRCC